MRMSNLFGRTLREAPADAEMPSHALLIRAAMIHPLAAGIYTFLPLGWRVIRRIEQIIREEMEAIGAQEMSMPVVHPAELWQETGRWDELGSELVRFTDRTGRGLVLGMTHEEVVAYLARFQINSYRQLPLAVYQFQTKIRDELRPRGGLLRVREFIMKDAYSLDADQAGLDAFYPRIYQAYLRIFQRCGLDPLAVEADPGIMGGMGSHEFVLINAYGEDTVAVCAQCEYAANLENARTTWVTDETDMLPIEEVATPGVNTIAGLADFLGIPARHTAKAVFYSAGKELIFAVIRGDLEINETKLTQVLGTSDFEPASEEAIQAIGAVPGYASPVHLAGKARIIVDQSVVAARNLVAGANKTGYHLRNVNYGRDYTADQVVDIATVRPGDKCPRCDGDLTLERGIELGHVFKLGTRYSKSLGATFLDPNGKAQPIVMGSYGIGLGRLMAAIAEEHHDENGLVWPPAVAPADVHLVGLGLKDEEIRRKAEEIYLGLVAEAFDVLFDDRNERAGVKFNDADLIGVPVRVTVSSRALQRGGVEVKMRSGDKPTIVPLNELPEYVAACLTASNGDGSPGCERG